MPRGKESAIIKSIGFALAFGILIDAFVVRVTLIPALLGERAVVVYRAGSSGCCRALDVEGERLSAPPMSPGRAHSSLRSRDLYEERGDAR